MLTVDDLKEICKALPVDIIAALQPTFENIAFESKVLKTLRDNPQTIKNPAMQKAFRQMTQTYQQDIKLVLWQLRNNESSAADDLLAKLSEFE